MPKLLQVFLYGLITAISTGLGALPFAFIPSISSRTIGYANAVASGLMLGASFGLIDEGTTYGAWQTLVGAGLGVLFIVVAERLLGFGTGFVE